MKRILIFTLLVLAVPAYSYAQEAWNSYTNTTTQDGDEWVAYRSGTGMINVLSEDIADYVSTEEAGTTLQAYDAQLNALAGLSPSANRVPYFTGSTTADTFTSTSFTRGMMAGSNAATVRGTLGVVDRECMRLTATGTDASTGTGKANLYFEDAITVTGVYAWASVAPVGSTIIVDINEAGTSIMTTNKLSIDANEKTSGTAATAAGVTDTTIAANAEITFDVDQIGSGTAGQGIVACIEYTY